MRFIRTRADLRAEDLPLRVYGARMCGRCHEVREALSAAGIPHADRDMLPEEIARGVPLGVDRHEAASVLAAFTWQDGTLPAILTWGLDGFIRQARVESVLVG